MSEIIEIPKVLADEIRKMPWFAYYKSLEDFVLEGTRRLNEKWMTVWTVREEAPRPLREAKGK